MSDHMATPERCPATGDERTDEFRECWTRHDRPGVFNACPRCDDGPTGRERLHLLNEHRARQGVADVRAS